MHLSVQLGDYIRNEELKLRNEQSVRFEISCNRKDWNSYDKIKGQLRLPFGLLLNIQINITTQVRCNRVFHSLNHFGIQLLV